MPKPLKDSGIVISHLLLCTSGFLSVKKSRPDEIYLQGALPVQ